MDKRFKRLPETGVQLTFTIGSVDSFREDLKNAEQQSGQTVPVVYENKTNDWTNVLINLLPWVLIIACGFSSCVRCRAVPEAVRAAAS